MGKGGIWEFSALSLGFVNLKLFKTSCKFCMYVCVHVHVLGRIMTLPAIRCLYPHPWNLRIC